MSKNKGKNSGCLLTGLKIIGILYLIPIILLLGWIAGIIWLIFFRKKLNDNPEKQKKYTIGISAASAFSFFLLIFMFATASPSPTTLELVSEYDGETLEVNNDYSITVKYEPEDATLSSVTYTIDDPSMASITPDSENPSLLTLHTESEGTITVVAKYSDIKSNILTFNIIDSEKVHEEPAEDLLTEETPADDSATDEVVTDDASEENTTISSGAYTIMNSDFFFSDYVLNDITGNWKLSRVTTTIDATEYAADYYKTLFSSDDEIHAIVNFTTNTTTKISVIMDGTLEVTVYEYVENEEHDANALFGGMLLAQYWINIETGEVETIQEDSGEEQEQITEENASTNSETETPSETTDTPVSDSSASDVGSSEPTPPEPVEQPTATSSDNLVWIDDTAKKYHAKNGCGMDNAYQVTKAEAIALGKGPCGRCYK